MRSICSHIEEEDKKFEKRAGRAHAAGGCRRRECVAGAPRRGRRAGAQRGGAEGRAGALRPAGGVSVHHRVRLGLAKLGKLADFANFWQARSRLYRNEILQVNMRSKALAEIYTMHSFALL